MANEQKIMTPISHKLEAVLQAEGFDLLKSEYVRGEMEHVTINSHELEG